MPEHALNNKVALIAGATRGAGRGTAIALGEAGATVYCTGRSTRRRRSEYDRPETIEETAELAITAGGTGIAVAVDQLHGEQVQALAADPDLHERNGGSFSSGGLAREYGFTDVDGSGPDCWRYMVEVQDAGLPPDPTGYR